MATIALSALHSPTFANPLAEAEAGKLACFRPNRELKTCWIIIAFKKSDDGSYLATQKNRASNTTDYEMRGEFQYVLQGERFCYKPSKEDIAKTRFFHLGDEVLHQDLDVLRHALEEQVQDNFGKTWCYELKSPSADGIYPIASFIDGVPDNSSKINDKMIWIAREEGYKLRPAAD